jgi:2-keto-4-pentenoate hydratase/2-oxohepta-3-ene-1,7-dioic acid hydratase in catechol pathway
MRFVTAKIEDESFVGLVDEKMNTVVHLQRAGEQLSEPIHVPDSMIECIAAGDRFVEQVKQIEAWVDGQGDSKNEYIYDFEKVELHAPIPRPQKNIFCVGKNYAAHAIEMGSAADIPEHPMVFSKSPTTVIGHEQKVLNHSNVTEALDYEGELAVVIGKTGRSISKEDAMEYVFGYTLINDVTARDLQTRHKQYLIGKSLDTFCPMGPYIIHHTEIEDPHNLNVETKVNGEVRQSSNTNLFIFDIPTLIETLSKGMTLEAGDIIATGTPAGVGKGFKPPKFLKPGDTIEITVEKVGTLRNQISE